MTLLGDPGTKRKRVEQPSSIQPKMICCFSSLLPPSSPSLLAPVAFLAGKGEVRDNDLPNKITPP